VSRRYDVTVNVKGNPSPQTLNAVLNLALGLAVMPMLEAGLAIGNDNEFLLMATG
jgi:hypothetical protein